MDEDHSRDLELFWFPARDRTARELLEAARRSAGVLDCVPPDSCTSAFGRVVRGLAHALTRPSHRERRVTAGLLRKAFSTLGHPVLQHCMPEELQEAIPALIRATEDADPIVQHRVLSALGIAVGRGSTSAIVQAVARNTLNSPRPGVVAASLKLLRSAGVDAASVAVPGLIRLLNTAAKRLRGPVCRTLGWLEEDARSAVPELLDVATQDADATLRREAVLALVRIDPTASLVCRVLPRSQQNQFLGILRDTGAEARGFRRALQNRLQTIGLEQTDTAPPGFEGVWPRLTETERRLLKRMWENRRPDGLPATDLYPLMGWEGSLDPGHCLRAHLSHIYGKLRQQQVPVPFERAEGRIHWPRRPR
jgi:hypothetical protein